MDLEKIRKKLEKIEKVIVSIIVEDDLIIITNPSGDVRGYSPYNYSHRTDWGDSIEAEGRFVKLLHWDGDVCYYTPDLTQSTGWGKWDSLIIVKNKLGEFAELTRSDGKIRYYTPDLTRSTGWGDSIEVEGRFLKLTRKKKVRYYTPDLARCTDEGKIIAIKDGFVELTHENEKVRGYTMNLAGRTGWGKSMIVKNGGVTLIKEEEYNINLKKID